MKELNSDEKRELYIKAFELVRQAKIHKYMVEKDIIYEEGMSFWGFFSGQNALQYERIRNVKLKIELAHTERIEEKNDYKIIDTLAYLNSSAINEFNGKLTNEMQKMYNDIKENYCDETITDEEINKISCQKSDKIEKYLPIIYNEKTKGVFCEIRNQIKFYKVENQKLEDLIVKARGKMQFETFSSQKGYEVVVPNKQKCTVKC